MAAPLAAHRESLGGLNRASGIIAKAQFIATNVPLRTVIIFAYALKSYQVVGGASWIGTDRFSIEARAGGEVPVERMRRMAQALLAERFKLVVHRETRERAGYALVVVRDGRLGPNLLRSTVNGPLNDGPGSFTAKGASMSTLADALSGVVGLPVVDRTNLSGGFDIELRWSPEFERTPGGVVSDAPSIFTAVQEQLGLTLESQQVPLDVLVVDSVDRPTEN